MSEAVGQVAARRSPLDDIHRREGAEMKERDGWSVPASYDGVTREYEAVRGGGAGLLDLSSRGRVEVSGTEAVQFLNGLVTNDVKALEDNAWMQAVFPNAQGRILAAARVIKSGDSFLFETEAATTEQIMKTLSRFTLAGDFRVRDLTDETALLSVQGASASRIIASALKDEAARVERGRVRVVQFEGETVRVIRATHTAEDGFDVFASARLGPTLWEALRGAGAVAVGDDALEILRVEAGVPRYGVDMDETRVVLETGLDEAVSYTKGCYIGQEIIARIHWRGHVAKRLAGVLLDAGAEAARDDKLRNAGGKEVGVLTSVARSPRLGRAVALGYIKYDYLAPGTELRVVHGESEQGAQVVALPFVRGSWYEPEAAEQTGRV